jgi:hypothetical protein
MSDSSSIAPAIVIAPLEGEVCEQYIRCGKPKCRCQTGHLHGPYHYRIWREGTRVRKVYVRAAEVETVKAACDVHRALTRRLRDVKQVRQSLTSNILKEWRQTQRYLGK